MLRTPRSALARVLRRPAESAPTRGRRPAGSQGARPGRQARSGVTATPLLSTPGFRLCVAAILKNEASYIEEWLCYHRALGVDHFFLYDNGSTDDIATVLRPYIAHGIVTHLDWPGHARQISGYNHALRFFGPLTAWLAFIDLDEFIVPQQDPDVPTFLARLADADQVLLPMREFGFSGHRTRPPGLVLESYTLAHDEMPRNGGGDPRRVRVKSIVRPGAVVEVSVHNSVTASGRTVDPEGRMVAESWSLAQPGFTVAQLNHYYTKSFEEYEGKRVRGSATGRQMRPEIPFDLPGATPDSSGLRFLERTRRQLEEMASLDPDPYRFGSHLALAGFPRYDRLDRHLRSILSNLVAGVPEPRADQAFAPDNLFAGNGLVMRADSQGYEPSRGCMAGSVHVRWQVERMRGHLAWSLGGDASGDGAATSRLAAGGRLELPTGEGARRRCQSVAFALRVSGPARIDLAARGPEAAAVSPPAIELPAAGAYIGFLEVNAEPRLVESVTLEVGPDAGEVELLDLLLVTYG